MQLYSEHTFGFDWETVIKGFWNKYPCKELDFIKFNSVVDMTINNDNTMSIKRLVLSKKLLWWWLTMEEIKLDFQSKTMEMQTKFVKSCKLFPNMIGDETIVYKAKNNSETYYTKLLENISSSLANVYMKQFQQSFKKGIEVVENKCLEALQKQTQQF